MARNAHVCKSAVSVQEDAVHLTVLLDHGASLLHVTNLVVVVQAQEPGKCCAMLSAMDRPAEYWLTKRAATSSAARLMVHSVHGLHGANATKAVEKAGSTVYAL